MDKEGHQPESRFVKPDGNFNRSLEDTFAESWGLTVEEYRTLRALDTNEEMEAYVSKHSSKDWSFSIG